MFKLEKELNACLGDGEDVFDNNYRIEIETYRTRILEKNQENVKRYW